MSLNKTIKQILDDWDKQLDTPRWKANDAVRTEGLKVYYRLRDALTEHEERLARRWHVRLWRRLRGR